MAIKQNTGTVLNAVRDIFNRGDQTVLDSDQIHGLPRGEKIHKSRGNNDYYYDPRQCYVQEL